MTPTDDSASARPDCESNVRLIKSYSEEVFHLPLSTYKKAENPLQLSAKLLLLILTFP